MRYFRDGKPARAARRAQWAARASVAVFVEIRSVHASSNADKTKVMCTTTCYITALSAIGLEPSSMKVLRRWEVDGRDADEGGGELDLEHAGVDVGKPLGLVRVAVEVEAGDERLVTAHDHHDQQVSDHHHVDQAQHGEHDGLFIDAARRGQQVPQLDEEVIDVDTLGQDQSDVERGLQPATQENEAVEGALRGMDGKLVHGERARKEGAPVRASAQSAAGFFRRDCKPPAALACPLP
jgi:hypothetical protein